jgi:uncharacterized cupredoxin-like copper-binding protein
MKLKFALRAVCGLLSLAFLALPAQAADSKTIVNVALLDMSAVAGGGMMGPGWGGGAGPGWGGMMGQGWNGGAGPGPGWGGMMGPGGGRGGPGWGGMGGYGMGMGMMSIRTDKATVKAGEIHFAATNWSRGVIHEMLVVAVDNPNAPLPYDYNAGVVPEKQVKVMGEIAELQPNASGSLDAKLAPGSYLLLCNVPGHYAAGMVTPLTVTP